MSTRKSKKHISLSSQYLTPSSRSKTRSIRRSYPEDAVINYTYLLESSDGELLSEEDYNDIYNQIILRYHYPICLNATVELDNSEKKQILKDEYAFIQSKLPGNVRMYKIPRVLYDMFFILFHEVFLYDRESTILFKIGNKSQNYLSYCEEANRLHQQITESTRGLNDYIIQYLNARNIRYRNATYIDYTKTLNSIVTELNTYIHTTYPNNKQAFYSENKARIIDHFVKSSGELTNRVIKMIRSIIPATAIRETFGEDVSYIDKKYTQELIMAVANHHLHTNIVECKKRIKEKQITEAEGKKEMTKLIMDTLQDDADMADIIVKYNLVVSGDRIVTFVKNLNVTLLTKILMDETVSSLNSPSKFILYRGASDTLESPIGNEQKNQGYSVSYNTSALNGILADYSACTYAYMNNSKEDKQDNQRKHKYVLKRFFYGDGTVADNLFFIPPLHPYLQMSITGEFWHVRSKIFTGSLISYISKFALTYDGIDGIVGDKNSPFQFPDYLTSKYGENEIEQKFNRFIRLHRNEVQDKEQMEHVESNLFGGRR